MLTISKSNPNTLYVGTQGHGVFVTTDGAASWTAAGTMTNGRTIFGIAVSAQDPAYVYAASFGTNATYSSANGTAGAGTAWTPSDITSALGYAVVVDPTNKLVAYTMAVATSQIVFEYFDPTGTHTTITPGIDGPGDPNWHGDIAMTVVRNLVDGTTDLDDSGAAEVPLEGYGFRWLRLARPTERRLL